MGKIKVDTNEGFRDMATVLALNNDYCTAEPFIPGEFGIRVQKIGRSYRVYKKVATGSGWKSQVQQARCLCGRRQEITETTLS
jgi:hypothetical protein